LRTRAKFISIIPQTLNKHKAGDINCPDGIRILQFGFEKRQKGGLWRKVLIVAWKAKNDEWSRKDQVTYY